MKNIRKIMWDRVGITRNRNDLLVSIGLLEALRKEINESLIGKNESIKLYFVTKSACLVALMIARAALSREESRGDHCREDYPQRDDLYWLKHIVYSQSEKGELQIKYRDAVPQPVQSWAS